MMSYKHRMPVYIIDLQRPRSRAGEEVCCWDTCHGDGALTSGDGAHTPAAPALDTGLRIKDSTNTASTPNDGHSEPQHSTANTFDTHGLNLVNYSNQQFHKQTIASEIWRPLNFIYMYPPL